MSKKVGLNESRTSGDGGMLFGPMLFGAVPLELYHVHKPHKTQKSPTNLTVTHSCLNGLIDGSIGKSS